jgi:phosphatidylserine synthase
MLTKHAMNEYITDIQYFEGFVGGFGSLFSFIFFQKVLKLQNISSIVGLSFLTTWILRKVLMNIYIKLKNKKANKYNIKSVNLYIISIILISSLLAYIYAIKNISYLSVFVYALFILFFYLFVKQ